MENINIKRAINHSHTVYMEKSETLQAVQRYLGITHCCDVSYMEHIRNIIGSGNITLQTKPKNLEKLPAESIRSKDYKLTSFNMLKSGFF